MTRHICLDTETTGLDPKSGHRIIEIACVEVEDFIPTGNSFHRYINPDRDIEPEAEKVHGISRQMVANQPRFDAPEICEAFLDFIGDAPLVAHNAAFDRGFINAELERAGRAPLPTPRWICTYEMAKSRFPGAYNSLDALCKRFKISLAEREKHGALIDTKLLARVYLELSGGAERALDLSPERHADPRRQTPNGSDERPLSAALPRTRPLTPRLTRAEAEAHRAFVTKTLKDKTLWQFAKEDDAV